MALKERSVSMDTLSDNLFEIYLGNKRQKIRNVALCSLCGSLLAQTCVGNDNSFKVFLAACLATTFTAGITNLSWLVNKKYYKDSKRKLNNVGRELIILGYDLDNDAIKESTVYTDYEDGYLIEYYDKYDNLYYIYQLINDNEVKYYLLDSDDVDECLENENMREDITKIIEKGLNK